MKPKPIPFTGLALLAALCQFTPLRAVEPGEVVKATGVSQGLFVVVGTTDGSLESGLAALGKGAVLVQGITKDRPTAETVRARLAKDGQTGLASVAWVPDFTALPYNDHLANVVMADLDAPGAPALAEVMRVVSPMGVAYVRRKGVWAKEVKPMPKEMDEWTHYDHGPDGNPQSTDAIVAAPRGVQWFATNCGGRAKSTTRLADGRWIRSGSLSGPGPYPEYLWSRDAFNGLLQWRVDDSVDRGPQERMLVAGEGIVAGVISEVGPARILDAKTGAVRVVLSEGLQQPEKPKFPGVTDARRRMTMEQILLDGVLYQSYEDKLAAVRVSDGKRIWDYTAPSGMFITWVVGGEGGVFLGLTPMPTRPIVGYGQQFSPLAAIVGFDAATGKSRWSTEITAAKLFTSFGLTFFRGGIYTIDAGYRPSTGKAGGFTKAVYGDLLRVDARSGAITFRRDLSKVEPTDDQWHHKLRIQNDLIVPSFDNVIRGFDLMTGADGPVLFRRPPTMYDEMLFCSVGRGTIHGQVSGKMARFADFRDGIYYGLAIARGGCQEGMYPGYGMIYTGSDGCGCSSFLRGGIALQCSQATEAAKVPDTQRLERGVAVTLGAEAGKDTWPMLLRDNARTACAATAGPRLASPALQIGRTIQVPLAPILGNIGVDWAEDNLRCGAIAPPVIADGLLVTASTDAHKVHAYDVRTGAAKWTWNAGARVNSSPTLHRGLVFFGGQDGRITALRASDGALAWRFLAAPNYRQIVVGGQVESVWPVNGSVLALNGKVYVAAGRHNQVDGGIVLRRLDAATGALEATTLVTDQQVSTDPPSVPEGDGQGKMADILTVNATGKLLYMGPIVIDPASLAWARLARKRLTKKDPQPDPTASFFGTKGPQIGWNTPDLLAYVFAPSTGTVDRRVTTAGHKGQNGYRFMSYGAYENGYTGERIARDGHTLIRISNNDIYALDLNAAWLPADGKATDISQNEARRASGRKLAPVGNQTVALAVASDQIAVAANRYRERDFSIATFDRAGKPIAKIKLPTPIVTHGLVYAGGELHAALEDGRIVTFTNAP